MVHLKEELAPEDVKLALSDSFLPGLGQQEGCKSGCTVSPHALSLHSPYSCSHLSMPAQVLGGSIALPGQRGADSHRWHWVPFSRGPLPLLPEHPLWAEWSPRDPVLDFSSLKPTFMPQSHQSLPWPPSQGS